MNADYSDNHYPQRDDFNQFYPITLSELLDTVSHMRVSSSPLDVVPTKFLFRVMDFIGPHLLSVFNSSLFTGCVPDYFKTACVNPLLKKDGLNPSLRENYRLISKLPFI